MINTCSKASLSLNIQWGLKSNGDKMSIRKYPLTCVTVWWLQQNPKKHLFSGCYMHWLPSPEFLVCDQCVTYIQHQHSVPMQVVVCPSCSDAECKVVEVRVMGGHVTCLTFIQEKGVHILSQTCNWCLILENEGIGRIESNPELCTIVWYQCSFLVVRLQWPWTSNQLYVK